MNALVKAATIAAAVALSSQPCLAAVVEGQSPSLAATMAVSETEQVDFNLKTHASLASGQKRAGAFALATAAASSQEAVAAQELEERQRRGMSKGTQTALIVGGVVAVALLVGAVAFSQSSWGDWDWGNSRP
jgi:hypothetical protein